MRRQLAALALATLLPLPGMAAEVVVKSGETLSDIADRHGVSVTQLMQRNGIKDPNLVLAGTRLVLPGTGRTGGSSPGRGSGGDSSARSQASTHVVQPGETLSEIADRYGLSPTKLIQLNGIKDPNLVEAGTRLALRAKSNRPAATASARRPAAAPSGPTARYTVRDGETLSEIADRYAISSTKLMQLNGIAEPNLVFAGSQLIVPAPRSAAKPAAPAPTRPAYNRQASEHVVRPGETLSDIAEGYRVSMDRLISINHLEDPNNLLSGTRLKLRSAAPPTKPASKPPAPPLARKPVSKPTPKPAVAPAVAKANVQPPAPTPAPRVVTTQPSVPQPNPHPVPITTAAATPEPKPEETPDLTPEASFQPATASNPATSNPATSSPATSSPAAPSPAAAPHQASRQADREPIAPKPAATPATQQQPTVPDSRPRLTMRQPQPLATSTPVPTAATTRIATATAPVTATAATTAIGKATAPATVKPATPDWRSYGPLQIDWANWYPMGGSFVAPSLNRDGQPLYLAVNCSAGKINATTQAGQWNTWDTPQTDFEQQLVKDICRQKGS